MIDDFENDEFFTEEYDDSCKSICDYWLKVISKRDTAIRETLIEKLEGMNKNDPFKSDFQNYYCKSCDTHNDCICWKLNNAVYNTKQRLSDLIRETLK